jgi:adenylate cyclase
VQSGQSADALSQFFDSDVATHITTTDLAPMAGQSVMRDAAIMFTDLRGFTKASATLSAADLIALIGEYQNVVLPVVRAHGGNIDKFMGDGIGVAHGPLVFGIIGVERRLEYTVIGETVNLAAKLEKHNKAEDAAACATASLLALAKEQDPTLAASGFEIRSARSVAGTSGQLDLAVWPAG